MVKVVAVEEEAARDGRRANHIQQDFEQVFGGRQSIPSTATPACWRWPA